MRKYLMVTVAVSAAALLSFSAAKADVKVGVVAGLTGPIPDLVAPMVKNMQAAVSNINDHGGVLGQKLQAVVLDGQCGAQTAIDAGNKVVNVEQAVAVVGEVCSGATIGLADNVTVPAGILTVSPSASSPAITSLKDKDLVYRTAPSDAYQGKALAQALMKKGMKSVAVTYANDDYNAGIAKVFVESFKKAGGTVAAEQMHEPEKSSYRAELATLAKGGSDVLVIFAYYNSGGTTLLKQAIETGKFKTYVGADGMAAQKMVDDVGAVNIAGKSYWTANTVESTSAAFKAYVEVAKKYGLGDLDPTGPYLATSYDAMFLTALAIQASGKTDRAGLNASLRKVASAPGEVILPGQWDKAVAALKAGKDINYEGASGSVDFDENGDVTGVYSFNEVKDGKLVQIETIR